MQSSNVDERTQILNKQNPPEKNFCSCCVTQNCCQTYNRIGIFLFVLWLILQIVSISTSWHDFYLEMSENDRIVLSYFVRGVSISRSYQPISGQVFQINIYCPYNDTIHNHTNILLDPTSNLCPPSQQLCTVFPPIIGTSVVAILAEFAMILWLAYRSSKKGIDSLFTNKCSTQIISMILSIFIIGFTTAAWSLLPDRLDKALVMDYGVEFWNSYGCNTVYSSLYCQYQSCYNSACTYEQDGAGYIIAIVNMSLLTLGVFYTWIGSWCCSCCSCMETPSTDPYATITRNPEAPANRGLVTNEVPYLNSTKTFTLFVHHGSPLPTKLVLMASSFQELHSGIAKNIGVTVPFSVAVYDEQVKQYVMVTSLAAMPNQATVQLMF